VKRSPSPLSLSLAVMLGLSLAVFVQPSRIAYTGGRDGSHNPGNLGMTDADAPSIAIAVSMAGDTYTNDSNLFDPPDQNTNARGATYVPDFTDKTPEPWSMALIGAFLTLLGIALDRKYGSVRPD
jgi:hypothetical protein